MVVLPETMKTELEREKIVQEHESAGGHLDAPKPPEVVDAVEAHRHVPCENWHGLLLQVHSPQY